MVAPPFSALFSCSIDRPTIMAASRSPYWFTNLTKSLHTYCRRMIGMFVSGNIVYILFFSPLILDEGDAIRGAFNSIMHVISAFSWLWWTQIAGGGGTSPWGKLAAACGVESLRLGDDYSTNQEASRHSIRLQQAISALLLLCAFHLILCAWVRFLSTWWIDTILCVSIYV